MPNATIPLQDKQLVVQRLAEGASTRQAIAGTSVRSNQTAARWRREASHAITRHRAAYLAMIEATGLGAAQERAQMLGQMVWATKTLRVTLPSNPEAVVPLRRRDYFVEVEDWDARLRAIKYIDRLAGINPDGSMQFNVVQQQLTKSTN